MQSSSQLFPVALQSAEIRGDLYEDIYRLKPGNSPDPSVELVVTRLTQAEGSCGVPVVLLHGSFSNRRFWYSPTGIGLGPYLARLGFDVWIPEMRGHGLSPRNTDYRNNRIADYARYDLPAITAFVHEQSAQPVHWLGHSLGGTTLAAALGGQYLDQAQLASVALFGSQVSKCHWIIKVPPVTWLLRLMLRRMVALSGMRFKQGPEDEPVGVLREGLRIHGLFGRFADEQRNWWAGLEQVQVPMLAVSASGDSQDPAWACEKLYQQFGSPHKQFLCLGPECGMDSHFGHIEMLVSKEAQTHVWPLVAAWLQAKPIP